MVDISIKHLPALLASKEFEEYQTKPDGSQARHAHMIVHRVTNSVLRDGRFIDWVKKFGEKTLVSC